MYVFLSLLLWLQFLMSWNPTDQLISLRVSVCVFVSWNFLGSSLITYPHSLAMYRPLDLAWTFGTLPWGEPWMCWRNRVVLSPQYCFVSPEVLVGRRGPRPSFSLTQMLLSRRNFKMMIMMIAISFGSKGITYYCFLLMQYTEYIFTSHKCISTTYTARVASRARLS